MKQAAAKELQSRRRAAEIVRRALGGEYDLLLACRDIASMQPHLAAVPDEILNIFAGVASEVDDLPIGPERRYWRLENLVTVDAVAGEYRERVRSVVTAALQDLKGVLDGVSKSTDV